MVEQLNSIIDSLSLDHKRGAAEIVQDAAELFVEVALYAVDNPEGADHIFERAVKRLAKGQPSMAPVLNLLNHVCFLREKSGEDWVEFNALVPEIFRLATDYHDSMRKHLDQLPVAKTLIAFSNSSTVAQMIISVHKEYGWPENIICGEGRPIMEGLVIARKLTAAGLNVTVYTDAAMMSLVTEADAVWVGGDSLSRDGLVNKVGSRALAMLCQYRGIPFISMMASDKLLPTELAPHFKSLPQNPREIGADDADSLKIHNEYYETIPLKYVSHVFTENGLSAPEAVVSSIENEPLSALFDRLATR